MMKHFSFILIFMIPIVLNAYTDLGTWGAVYKIKEKVVWKDQNMTKVKKLIKKDFNKSFISATTSNETLPTCTKTQTRIWNPTTTLDHTIDMPKFHIHIPKGTKFNPLKYTSSKRYFILIDGSDKYQIMLAEHYKYVANIIIYNGNVDVVKPNFSTHIYIANKTFTKTFKAKCLPSIYSQKNDKFIIKEINIKSLVEKDKK